MSRYDRFSRDGMPDSAAMEGIQQSIRRTMKDVIADFRHGVPQSASMIPERLRPSEPVTSKGGWQDPAPLTPKRGLWSETADEKRARVTAQQERENAEIEKRLRHRDHDPYTCQGLNYDPLSKFDRSIQSLHDRNSDDD